MATFDHEPRQDTPTVRELFEQKGLKDLLKYLDNEGHFWTRVKDNSIPNSELLADIRSSHVVGKLYGRTHKAEVELLALRSEGLLPTPPEPEQDKK